MSKRPELETDDRFPSGRWIGFFLQQLVPGRHQMELILNFSDGTIRGEGRDWVGAFLIAGHYNLEDGKCRWTKRYVRKHDVHYEGFNEGKGIWGVWKIPPDDEHVGQQGGFHIWPEGTSDPTGESLSTAKDLPVEEDNVVRIG